MAVSQFVGRDVLYLQTMCMHCHQSCWSLWTPALPTRMWQQSCCRKQSMGQRARCAAASCNATRQIVHLLADHVHALQSEVLVIADAGAPHVHVAADMLSQGEHGPESQVRCCQLCTLLSQNDCIKDGCCASMIRGCN